MLLLILAILPHTPLEGIQRHVQSFYVSQPETEVRLANQSPSRFAQRAATVFVSEPEPSTLREHVDLMEVNHHYDDSGRLVFDQLLFRDWHSGDGMHHLRAWRMIKPGSDSRQSIQSPPMLPRYSQAHGVWVVEWFDDGKHRRVTATAYRESWTQYDPELTEREFLPKEKRRELRKQ